MGVNSGESDPILNESEISIELQISQDKIPIKTPKIYSHEKKE